MSGAREQLAADLAAVLADPSGPADLVNINGVSLRAISQPVDWLPSDNQPGVHMERERYFLIQADLGFVPVPWQELFADGRRWTVEAVVEKGPVIELVLVRYLS